MKYTLFFKMTCIEREMQLEKLQPTKLQLTLIVVLQNWLPRFTGSQLSYFRRKYFLTTLLGWGWREEQPWRGTPIKLSHSRVSNFPVDFATKLRSREWPLQEGIGRCVSRIFPNATWNSPAASHSSTNQAQFCLFSEPRCRKRHPSSRQGFFTSLIPAHLQAFFQTEKLVRIAPDNTVGREGKATIPFVTPLHLQVNIS